MRSLITFLIATTLSGQAALLPPEKMTSQFAGDRTVRIYLPPSYETAPNRRYPVLYLHDGQNVFTSAGPYAAFGWGNWGLDQTADRLSKEGKMQEIIMVAIDNTPARYLEYRGPSYPKADPNFGGTLPQQKPG